MTPPSVASSLRKLSRRSPNQIDAHVGLRMRMRRMILGITQESLSERLGVTFQQVQKYERGINRISAGRLYEISVTLAVPVQYFFEGLEQKPAASGSGLREAPAGQLDDWDDYKKFSESLDGIHFNRNFLQIQSADVRRALQALLKALAAAGHPPPGAPKQGHPSEAAKYGADNKGAKPQ